MHFSCFTFVHSLASVWIISVVILGFMLFVLSLRKNHYKVQFSLVSPSFGVTRRGLELLSLSSAQAMVLLHVTSAVTLVSIPLQSTTQSSVHLSVLSWICLSVDLSLYFFSFPVMFFHIFFDKYPIKCFCIPSLAGHTSHCWLLLHSHILSCRPCLKD